MKNLTYIILSISLSLVEGGESLEDRLFHASQSKSLQEKTTRRWSSREGINNHIFMPTRETFS